MAGERPKSQKKRSRTAVLLVSSGLWLLYFDLLTTMPGCTGTVPGADAAADGQAFSDGSGPDAWLSIPDASRPPDAAPFVDASFPDAQRIVDAAPFVDSAPVPDSAPFADGSVTPLADASTTSAGPF